MVAPESESATARTAATILDLYRKSDAEVPLAHAHAVLRPGHVAPVRVRPADERDVPRRDTRERAAGAPAQAVARQPELVPARAIAHGDAVAARGDGRPAHRHGPAPGHRCGEPARPPPRGRR